MGRSLIWLGVCLGSILGLWVPTIPKQRSTLPQSTYANVSPTGKIAFVSDRVGSDQIYIMNADGSGQRRLTYSVTDYWNVALSPDGKQITFSAHLDGRYPTINIMNIDFSYRKRLTRPDSTAYSASWAPNGHQVVYAACCFKDTYSIIYTITVDGSKRRQLTTSGLYAEDVAPAWSPDGHYIVFIRHDTFTDKNLFLMNTDGTNLHPIGSVAYDLVPPSWSPDSKAIVVSGHNNIYMLTLQNQNTSVVAQFIGNGWNPSWSPDGEYIAFSEKDENGDEQIYIMRPHGTQRRQLTKTHGRNRWPSWSR